MPAAPATPADIPGWHAPSQVVAHWRSRRSEPATKAPVRGSISTLRPATDAAPRDAAALHGTGTGVQVAQQRAVHRGRGWALSRGPSPAAAPDLQAHLPADSWAQSPADLAAHSPADSPQDLQGGSPADLEVDSQSSSRPDSAPGSGPDPWPDSATAASTPAGRRRSQPASAGKSRSTHLWFSRSQHARRRAQHRDECASVTAAAGLNQASDKTDAAPQSTCRDATEGIS